MNLAIKLFFLISFLHVCWGGRILCVFPTPTHGTNAVYRVLVSELVERGFELVVLTTEPSMYQQSEFVTVINLGDISHKVWAKRYLSRDIRRTMINTYFSYYDVMLEITAEQLKTDDVQKIINSPREEFDLLLVESYIPVWYSFAAKFDVPIVAISPESPGIQDFDSLGVPTHPYLYPETSMFVRHDVENLGFFERFSLFFQYFDLYSTFNKVYMPKFEMLAKSYFGSDVSLRKLQEDINVLIVGVHPLMLGVRPTVPGVVFAGNIHVGHYKELPEWLNKFMESAGSGVVLFSLGSNVMSQYLPPDKIKIFVEAFSELPYKFIWKWETKTLPGHPENVLTYDWIPQEDILANTKTMAFITAGGRQSIDEAIHHQVPMLGIPIFGEHRFNVAKMTELGLGLQLDFRNLNKEDLKKAIIEIVTNDTIKDCLADVRLQMDDEPMHSIDKALWWIEYTIRHTGAAHLKPRYNSISSYKYYFLDVICFLVILGIIALGLLAVGVYRIKNRIKRRSSISSYHDPKKMT